MYIRITARCSSCGRQLWNSSDWYARAATAQRYSCDVTGVDKLLQTSPIANHFLQFCVLKHIWVDSQKALNYAMLSCHE